MTVRDSEPAILSDPVTLAGISVGLGGLGLLLGTPVAYATAVVGLVALGRAVQLDFKGETDGF